MQSASSSPLRDSTRKPNRGKGSITSTSSLAQKKRKGSKFNTEVAHTPPPGEELYLSSDHGKHKDLKYCEKLKLSWTKTESLDFGLLCGQTATWENTVYFKNGGSNDVIEYSQRSNTWVRLVPPPYRGFALVVLHGLVTAVGGYDIRQHKDFNKLVSLVDGKWVEQYPPMPTARHYATAVVASGPKLIVAGGSVGNNIRINTIEVMDVQTKTWQKADNLPLPLSSTSLNISGDDLYLVGGFDNRGSATSIASTCKISDLLRSTEEKPQKGPHAKLMGLSLWRQIVDVPTTHTACAVLDPPGGNGGNVGGGHLVAVGGLKSSKRPTGDVYRYEPCTNVWEIAGTMSTPRCCVGVAASPGGGEMMVVGGTNRQMGSADCTNLLEVATF